jgi:hypothetical protein
MLIVCGLSNLGRVIGAAARALKDAATDEDEPATAGFDAVEVERVVRNEILHACCRDSVHAVDCGVVVVSATSGTAFCTTGIDSTSTGVSF